MRDSLRSSGWGVVVLALLLLTWEPLWFAWRASAALSRLSEYGLTAMVLLAFRGGVVGIGIAAGRGLLAGARHGLVFAQMFLVLSAVGTLWTFLTPYFPSMGAPSEALPRLLLALSYYGAWSAYLCRSKRVREAFGG